MGIAEGIAALVLSAGGVMVGGLFGAVAFALLFGWLRLPTKLATTVGSIAGASLGVWFAFVVVGEWDNPRGKGGDYEQPDEDRWLRR